MNRSASPFVVIDGPEGFRHGSSLVRYNTRARSLMLAQRQQLRLPEQSMAEGLLSWANSRPAVIDTRGQLGQLDTSGRSFVYRSDPEAAEGEPVRATQFTAAAADAAALLRQPVVSPEGCEFVDIALGGGSLAALPFSNGVDEHGLTVVSLQRRWQVQCGLSARPLRADVDSENRIWVLMSGGIGWCSGSPLPHPYTPDPTRFEPEALNPSPLRQRGFAELADLQPLSFCVADGLVCVLGYREQAEAPGYRLVLAVRRATPRAGVGFEYYPIEPLDLPFAVDVAAAGSGRWALLVPHHPGESKCDTPVVELEPSLRVAQLLTERYPTIRQTGARFVGHTSAVGGPWYLSAGRSRRLVALPQARYATAARVVLLEALDAQAPQTHWNRLYLEACIPEGTELKVAVRAFEDPSERGNTAWLTQPMPLFIPLESELPFRGGYWRSRPSRQGLFEVLLQRPAGAVREVRGRYLQLRLILTGDGRHSPAVHAVRAYYPRLSWQEAYLPRHFHQQALPPSSLRGAGATAMQEAGIVPSSNPLEGVAGALPVASESDPEMAMVAANGADFRQRLLCCFEGMLTPIEDRIAAGEVLLDPLRAPEALLPQIGGLAGDVPPAHWPVERRRRYLACLGDLQRFRGTLLGLSLALDLATDGAVRRGSLVVVENFRFRRTLGTILGLDLDDTEHPLTLGTAQSGNSRVGESLILTAENAREFLALLAPELALADAEDAEVVREFFDRYSHRITVLIHGSTSALEPAVQEVLTRLVPAHLSWTVRTSEHPLVLGLAPLLGIDTYLERSPAWRRVVLGDTYLGREGIVENVAALGPQIASQPPMQPVPGDDA